MIILDSQVDKATHAVNDTLKKAAISLDSDQLCALNEVISSFLKDRCAVDVKEDFTFDDLSVTQRDIWLDKAQGGTLERKTSWARTKFDANNSLLPMSDELISVIDELSVAAAVGLVFDTGGDENLHIFSALPVANIFEQVMNSPSLLLKVGEGEEELVPYLDSITYSDVINLCNDTYDSTRSALENLCKKMSL